MPARWKMILRLAVVTGPRVGLHDPDPDMRTWARHLSLGVAKPDGTGFQLLTKAGQGVSSPVFTGDGKHILCVQKAALWITGALGTNPTRLANVDATGNYYGYVDSRPSFAYHP